MQAKANASRRLIKTSTPGIFRRGGGYVVVFRDANRKQHKRSAKTLAEARALRASLTADVQRGEYRESSRISFADYAVQWIDTYDGRTARGVRAGTLRDYRRQLGLDAEGEPSGRGAIAFFGRTPLASIRAQDVKAYAAHVAARGVAKNTVRLAVAPVKAMLATAHEEGVIRSNPRRCLHRHQEERCVACHGLWCERKMEATLDQVEQLAEEIRRQLRGILERCASRLAPSTDLLALHPMQIATEWGEHQVGWSSPGSRSV